MTAHYNSYIPGAVFDDGTIKKMGEVEYWLMCTERKAELLSQGVPEPDAAAQVSKEFNVDMRWPNNGDNTD